MNAGEARYALFYIPSAVASLCSSALQRWFFCGRLLQTNVMPKSDCWAGADPISAILFANILARFRSVGKKKGNETHVAKAPHPSIPVESAWLCSRCKPWEGSQPRLSIVLFFREHACDGSARSVETSVMMWMKRRNFEIDADQSVRSHERGSKGFVSSWVKHLRLQRTQGKHWNPRGLLCPDDFKQFAE